MDVTVSHLNHRLALQLPAELPLGLVFVVGNVANLEEGKDGRLPTPHFDLIEQSHRVSCVLSERTAKETDLHDGDLIRAGGHLAFDAQRAAYFLLVRDVEVVMGLAAEVTAVGDEQAGLAAALADVKKRSDAVRRGKETLPPWVQKIAPPEVQAELEVAEGGEAPPVRYKEEIALQEDVVARLSAAMDSEDEVELTPDMLVELTAVTPPSLAEEQEPVAEQPIVEVGEEEETAVPPPPPIRTPLPVVPKPVKQAQQKQKSSDGFITTLIYLFIVLAVLLIVVIAYLLLTN